MSCTTVLLGKKATNDGSTMIARTEDFMFELSRDEYNTLIASIRSQFVTLEDGRGKYPKYTPFAFTEQGVAMLSSVLRSDVAIAANIAIMRAFVQVRE